jgi:hypothetical protein
VLRPRPRLPPVTIAMGDEGMLNLFVSRGYVKAVYWVADHR